MAKSKQSDRKIKAPKAEVFGPPTFDEENAARQMGYLRIAGTDEVGRGPLAGPVVAAAVILPLDFEADWKPLVNDSKQVTPARREELFLYITEIAVGFGIGESDVRTIDSKGIAKASRLAMKKAVDKITPPPDFLLVDFFNIPEIKLPQKGITHGDCLSFSIACASIIAKVTRDHMMEELDKIYPEYKFAVNKGYSTPEHLACLQRFGPSPIHRCSFQPVRDVMAML
jgi:ribonuclease HII